LKERLEILGLQEHQELPPGRAAALSTILLNVTMEFV